MPSLLLAGLIVWFALSIVAFAALWMVLAYNAKHVDDIDSNPQ